MVDLVSVFHSLTALFTVCIYVYTPTAIIKLIIINSVFPMSSELAVPAVFKPAKAYIRRAEEVPYISQCRLDSP